MGLFTVCTNADWLDSHIVPYGECQATGHKFFIMSHMENSLQLAKPTRPTETRAAGMMTRFLMGVHRVERSGSRARVLRTSQLHLNTQYSWNNKASQTYSLYPDEEPVEDRQGRGWMEK